MKLIQKKAEASDVTDVITHDVSPLLVNTDASAYRRMGWLIVLVGVVGFLLWATFAPLDKGVPMSGTVASESSRKAVQHLQGGTIADILVKDGDVVKAGQVLVRMNSVTVTSQIDSTLSQYYTARAAEARLLAERDGKASVGFPPALAKQKNDPRVAEVIALQSQLFVVRKAAVQNELAAIDENIEGLKSQQKGLEDQRDSMQEQQGFLKSQLDGMRELARDGYVARNRLLDLERTYAQLSGARAEAIGNLGRVQRQIMELKLRRAQRTQEVQREVRGMLVDTQREAEALEARTIGQQFDVSNADVKAPVDGIVVGLQVFTRGGVIPPGFKLMDIVPADDLLVAEGQMPVNLVDKVHKDLPVELVFSAFNASTTPHIPGVVTSVSADRLVDERTGVPYYRVRARVTPEGAKLAAKLAIRPGMPVEMFVKTGERTMMNYLFKPLMDRAQSSMAEE